MENKVELKPMYEESVDLMFQTYRKALLEQISKTGNLISTCSSLESEQLQSSVSLLHLLFGQLSAVNGFLSQYKKLDETI